MANPVGWFEIYVDDMQRAKKFYEGVFQNRLMRLDSSGIEMWGFPLNKMHPGTSGSLVHIPGFPAGRNSTVVYFSCKDCSTEEKRIAEFGGRIEKTKFSIGQYGFITLAYDTEGNMIGLHSLQ